MAEEINPVDPPEENVQAEETQPEAPPAIDLDQKILVGGQEYSARDLATTAENYQQLEQYAKGLEGFREATTRLMNPETSPEVKKRDARQILLDMNYTPDQVDEWVQVYDQGQPMTENDPQEQQEFQGYDPRTDQLNDQVLKVRAQMLKQNLETELSSAMESDTDGKVLVDWLSNNRKPEDATNAKNNVAERVRSQALENLRQRRDYAGTFDDSWVGEEVKKAASKVAKDMLTVIGDTSMIGRVTETGGQSENLRRKEPVKLPNNTGKSFGEVEAQLRDWTSDQIMRSLSDSGGESKA